MEAARQAFDRETGQPVAIDQIKTYAECLAQYHLSPEAKFENGGYWDRGKTQRRHVVTHEVVSQSSSDIKGMRSIGHIYSVRLQCPQADLNDLFECLYRAGHLLDEAVILLDNVIEIFGPPNGDQPVATAHDK